MRLEAEDDSEPSRVHKYTPRDRPAATAAAGWRERVLEAIANLHSLISNLFSCPPAASSTSTWTRSTRRSSSATTRRCAAGRWPSAAARRAAASSRRRATRRGRSASARRSRWRAPSGSAPTLVIVRPDFERYRAVSQQVFEIFRGITPLVEPLSLDEAYLDVTENAWGEPLGMRVARRLKDEIRAATAPHRVRRRGAEQVPGEDRVGLAQARRPHRRSRPSGSRAFLQQLPIDALWGVGPVTARKLRAHGIEKLVDVRVRPLDELRTMVGSAAEWLQQLAHGIDDRAGRTEPGAQVGRQREHVRDRPDRDARDPRGARRHGARRRRVADAERRLRAHRHASRSATRTSRPSPAAIRIREPRRTPPRSPSGRSRCSPGPRPACARCGCSA